MSARNDPVEVERVRLSVKTIALRTEMMNANLMTMMMMVRNAKEPSLRLNFCVSLPVSLQLLDRVWLACADVALRSPVAPSAAGGPQVSRQSTCS